MPHSWVCFDCNANVRQEYYMVHNHIWRSALRRARVDGCVPTVYDMLCVTCLERRLGRELTPADFTTCALNRTGIRNPRLLQRMRLH